MKRILVRSAILLVLGTATLWMTNRTTALDCVNVTAMYDQMAACDDNFWSGASPYHDVVNHSPNHCNDAAHNAAWNACEPSLGSPSWSSCYDAAYANAYNNCVSQANSSYQQAIDSYSTCLWNANNPTC